MAKSLRSMEQKEQFQEQGAEKSRAVRKKIRESGDEGSIFKGARGQEPSRM